MTFAVSTSVQHQAAEGAPASAKGPLGLVRYLLGRPTWLVGQVMAVVGFAMHAAALHYGPIALVQPIVISGIVFAVPLRAAISRRLPSRQEGQAGPPAPFRPARFFLGFHSTPGNPP